MASPARTWSLQTVLRALGPSPRSPELPASPAGLHIASAMIAAASWSVSRVILQPAPSPFWYSALCSAHASLQCELLCIARDYRCVQSLHFKVGVGSMIKWSASLLSTIAPRRPPADGADVTGQPSWWYVMPKVANAFQLRQDVSCCLTNRNSIISAVHITIIFIASRAVVALRRCIHASFCRPCAEAILTARIATFKRNFPLLPQSPCSAFHRALESVERLQRNLCDI